MYEALKNQPRLLMEAHLAPVQGERFQPTGFPDIGAAVYRTPSGKRTILIESAQSMANRLEAVCLEGDGPMIAKELEGLPYILVNLTGDTKLQTSSLIEAHRLNSPFIISNPGFRDAFQKASGYSKGHLLDWRKLGAAIFRFDPNSLLHGVFMANLEDGRIKAPRALSAFIEANDVEEAASGGVKNNPFDPTGKMRAAGYDKDVYGNVPFHRVEYTARTITAYFNLDLALLAGYALPPEAEQLLIALALLKARRFLRCGLRLRTACDFCLKGELKITEPAGFVVPPENDLLQAVQAGITACAAKGIFSQPPVTVIETTTKRSTKESLAETADAEDTE